MKITETQLEEIAEDLEKGSKYRVAFELMKHIKLDRTEKEKQEYDSREYNLTLYSDCLKAINVADR